MAPSIVKIYSENALFQYIDTLRRRREKRHKHREFFVEGVRPINQALAHNWTITAFIYAPDQRFRWGLLRWRVFAERPSDEAVA